MGSRNADVLIDSQLWIEFFSRRKNDRSAEVARLIRTEHVVLAGPVLFEVLVGPRREGDRQYLQGRLRAFRLLACTEEVWLRAIDLGRLDGVARRRVPFSDVLIAAHAEIHRVALFTIDPHFDVFPGVIRHRP